MLLHKVDTIFFLFREVKIWLKVHPTKAHRSTVPEGYFKVHITVIHHGFHNALTTNIYVSNYSSYVPAGEYTAL